MYDRHTFLFESLFKLLAAPLTDELKDVLRELNRNNVVGYDAILRHLSMNGFKLGYVMTSFSSLPLLIADVQTNHSFEISETDWCWNITKQANSPRGPAAVGA